MNTRGRNNNSLCEKSMKVMSNIVKLSYLSFATRSLGTSASPPSTRRVRTPLDNPPYPPQFPQSLRSQEPKPISFLFHPAEKNQALSMIREEETVDGKASDYIRKVHDKNSKDLDGIFMFSADTIPPPPHLVLD